VQGWVGRGAHFAFGNCRAREQKDAHEAARQERERVIAALSHRAHATARVVVLSREDRCCRCGSLDYERRAKYATRGFGGGFAGGKLPCSARGEDREHVLRSSKRPSNRTAAEDVSTSASVTPSSRRAAAGKPGSPRGEQDEQGGKRRGPSASPSGGLSMSQMIGFCAGGAALLLILGLLLPNRAKENRGEKTREVQVKDEGEKTPCPELVKLAEQSAASGNKSAAVRYYTRAASRAEQEGNRQEALKYNMKAKDLIATSKLQDR
jgi:hypothetical protein